MYDNAAIWTYDQQVYNVALQEHKSTLFLGVKYAAFITEHTVQNREWDGFAGMGREGGLCPILSIPAGQVVWWEPPVHSCSPPPRGHFPTPIQSDAPSAVSLLRPCSSCSVPLSSCPWQWAAPGSAQHWDRCPPQIKVVLLAQAVTCTGNRDFPR